MAENNKLVEAYFAELCARLESQTCLAKKEHSGRFKIAFVCTDEACNQRLVCAMCMVNAENHKKLHSDKILPLREFKDYLIDCNKEHFASDISLITRDVAGKFSSKLTSCQSLCRQNIVSGLDTGFEKSGSCLKEKFAQRVTSPVESMAECSEEKIRRMATDFVAQRNTDIRLELDKSLEYVWYKGHEEKSLWDMGGIIMQRMKHRILYNKQIEETIKREVGELTQKYCEDVIRAVEKHFFVNEHDVARRIEKIKSQQNSDEKKLALHPKEISESSRSLAKHNEHSQDISLNITQAEKTESANENSKPMKSEIIGSSLLKIARPAFNNINITEFEAASPTTSNMASKPKKQEHPRKAVAEPRTGESKRASSELDELLEEEAELFEEMSQSIGELKPISEFDYKEMESPENRFKDWKTEDHQERLVVMTAGKAKQHKEAPESSSLQESAKGMTRNSSTFRKKSSFVVLAGINNLVQASALRRKERKGVNAFELWIPNDESQFARMFKQDLRFFSLNDILKPEDLPCFMQCFYELYYPGLFYIFLYYQSISMTYPGLSWMEMNKLMVLSGVVDQDFTEADCDKIYEDVVTTSLLVNAKENNVSHSTVFQSSLKRSGFMSYLARAALKRYYEGTLLMTDREPRHDDPRSPRDFHEPVHGRHEQRATRV